MSKEKFFMGYPVEFEKLCLVYPPKIKDLVTNDKYGFYLKTLTMSQEEIEDQYVDAGLETNQILTPLEFLLATAHSNSEIEVVIKEGLQFFLHEPVTLLYEQKAIIIGDLEQTLKTIKSVDNLRMINADNFFNFQNLVRNACGMEIIPPYDDTVPEKVRMMQAKARRRDRIKAEKGGGLDLYSSLSSLCCMNLGINPLNIGELSYAAFISLMERFQEKEKYSIDIQSLLAGADSKKIHPKNWMRNLSQDKKNIKQ